jgi:phospholipid transport system transporter-binding protein
MIECENGRCRLKGPVTIGNVTQVLEEGNRLFTAVEVTLDLSQVTEVDSTAVSLLLEWRRAARRENRRITYVNLPENLKSLAALYGVTELIEGG